MKSSRLMMYCKSKTSSIIAAGKNDVCKHGDTSTPEVASGGDLDRTAFSLRDPDFLVVPHNILITYLSL